MPTSGVGPFDAMFQQSCEPLQSGEALRLFLNRLGKCKRDIRLMTNSEMAKYDAQRMPPGMLSGFKDYRAEQVFCRVPWHSLRQDAQER